MPTPLPSPPPLLPPPQLPALLPLQLALLLTAPALATTMLNSLLVLTLSSRLSRTVVLDATLQPPPSPCPLLQASLTCLLNLLIIQNHFFVLSSISKQFLY